jgi:hypothetical protein
MDCDGVDGTQLGCCLVGMGYWSSCARQELSSWFQIELGYSCEFMVCVWLVGEGAGRDLSGAFMGTIIGSVVIWAPGLLRLGKNCRIKLMPIGELNGLICCVGVLVE